MHYRMVFPLLFGLACTEKSTTDTADSGTQDTSLQDTSGQDTGENGQGWTNICDGMPDSNHEILYSGAAYHDDFIMNSELTISDQSAWDDFNANLMLQNLSDSLTRLEIDWANEQVSILSVHVSSTCGLTLLESDSCTIESQEHLYLAVEDSSSGCETVCDAEGQVLLIVATPIGETNFTSQMIPGCSE